MEKYEEVRITKNSIVSKVISAYKRRGAKYLIKSIFRTTSQKLSFRVFYPDSIEIETTTMCNLNCKMCDHSWRVGKKGSMSFEHFKKIIDQFKFSWIYSPNIDLTGYGESLMNPDFLKMCEYIKSKKSDCFVYFASNFTLLTPKVAEKLIRLGIGSICISLDGATEQTYESIRVNAKWDTVISNLRSLIELKRKLNSNKPRISINCVALKENVHELPLLIQLAKDLGITNVSITQELFFDKNESLKADAINFKKFLGDAQLLADNYDITMSTAYFTKLPIKTCMNPWNKIYITYDGFLFPCCSSTAPRTRMINDNFGNLLEQDFKELWNSERYKKFRNDVRCGIVPRVCRNCQVYG